MWNLINKSLRISLEKLHEFHKRQKSVKCHKGQFYKEIWWNILIETRLGKKKENGMNEFTIKIVFKSKLIPGAWSKSWIISILDFRMAMCRGVKLKRIWLQFH